MKKQNPKHPNFKFSHNIRRHRLIYILLVIAFCLLALPITIHLLNTSSNTQKTVNSKTIPYSVPAQSNKTSSPKTSTPNTTPTTTSNLPANSSQTSTSETQALTVPPSGTFVSNHKPSLSGSTTPSEEQSTCNTIPGASCYIEFTNSSNQTKTLPAQIADGSGSVLWNWDVQQAGFTTGQWQITAIASLGGVTKSTTDSLYLEVQP
jgi:hypothetical protein